MQKQSEKIFFGSEITPSQKCCYKLSLLRKEYLLLAVNGLTNSPNILHITKKDFFYGNCFRSGQYIW